MATTSASTLPAMAPPAGLSSNLESPGSKAHIYYIVLSVCLGLTTPLVAVRTYTRCRIVKLLWWDDFVCLLAWINLIGYSSVAFLAIEYGAGVDVWNVSKQNYRQFVKYWKIIMILGRCNITLAKVSILLLFLRLFAPRITGSRAMWIAIWFMIVFNVIFAVLYILLVRLQCVLRKDPPPNGICLDQQLLLITGSAINVITEVAILVVPMITVRGMRMSIAKKIGVVAILSFGAAGIAFSLIRLIWQIATKNTNPTVYNMTLSVLSAAEYTVAIMTGCLPCLPAFYKFHFRNNVSQTSGRSSMVREPLAVAHRPKALFPLSIFTTELLYTQTQDDATQRA